MSSAIDLYSERRRGGVISPFLGHHFSRFWVVSVRARRIVPVHLAIGYHTIPQVEYVN
jgi:hypothetical protein